MSSIIIIDIPDCADLGSHDPGNSAITRIPSGGQQ